MIDSYNALLAATEDSWIRSVEFHDKLNSTNDRAIEIAANSSELPCLILANRQTHGRGRGSRRWWTTDGALTFSILLDPTNFHLRSCEWSLVSLISAVGVGRCLAEFEPGHRLAWKWPNDVYLGDRKVSGILLEAPFLRPARLVIGIGINVNNSSNDVLAAAGEDVGMISLSESLGFNVDSGDVLRRFLRAFDATFRSLAENQNTLGELWSQNDYLRGRRIRVIAGSNSIEGVAEGIASDGSLLVLTHRGIVATRSGTVEIAD